MWRENLGAFLPVGGQEKEKVRTCFHPPICNSKLTVDDTASNSLLPSTLVNFLGILALPVLLFVWFALVSVLSYSRINCELGSFQASTSQGGPLEHAFSIGAVWPPWGQKHVWGAEKSFTLLICEAQT